MTCPVLDFAGVDPLASNKGFWAQLLGVGDFYYELSVQVRLNTRGPDGGRKLEGSEGGMGVFLMGRSSRYAW